MTDTQTKPAFDQDAFINKFKDALPKMSPVTTAEMAVHMAISGIIQQNDKLEDGQKADLMCAAMRFYRITVLSEFVHKITTKDDQAFGLLLGDDPENIRHMKERLFIGAIQFDAEREKAAEHFRTLFEMLVDDPAEKETA